MKKITATPILLKGYLIFQVLFLSNVYAQKPTENSAPQTKFGKKLVWQDEFNGKGLPDTNKWGYDTGGDGFGNNEEQFYTENRLQNVRQENGYLVIEADKEKWKKNNYTSARIVTRDKKFWRYGTFEIRAKLPKGKGTWPAIWMLSQEDVQWPDDGEIDIMEFVGHQPDFVHATIHTKKYNHVIKTEKSGDLRVDGASDNFHTYRLDWTKDEIVAYVDNIQYFIYKNIEKTPEAWPFDKPFYMVLNLAIGGDWGGEEGIDNAIFPQKFLIDYVRVYQ